MKTTSAAVLLVLESVFVLLFQLAVAWDDFDDKFRLDKKVVDDSNIFGSDFEWWKRQKNFEIERSDKEDPLPYPLIDFDSSKALVASILFPFFQHITFQNCQFREMSISTYRGPVKGLYVVGRNYSYSCLTFLHSQG